MSLKLIFRPNATKTESKICTDYWSYLHNGRYIEHVNKICTKHAISHNLLFEMLSNCKVYLDDVHCAYCGSAYQIAVPADALYARQLTTWFCESCIKFSSGALTSS